MTKPDRKRLSYSS